jgi:hypothetical protein
VFFVLNIVSDRAFYKDSSTEPSIFVGFISQKLLKKTELLPGLAIIISTLPMGPELSNFIILR